MGTFLGLTIGQQRYYAGFSGLARPSSSHPDKKGCGPFDWPSKADVYPTKPAGGQGLSLGELRALGGETQSQQPVAC